MSRVILSSASYPAPFWAVQVYMPASSLVTLASLRMEVLEAACWPLGPLQLTTGAGEPSARQDNSAWPPSTTWRREVRAVTLGGTITTTVYRLSTGSCSGLHSTVQ